MKVLLLNTGSRKVAGRLVDQRLELVSFLPMFQNYNGCIINASLSHVFIVDSLSISK